MGDAGEVKDLLMGGANVNQQNEVSTCITMSIILCSFGITSVMVLWSGVEIKKFSVLTTISPSLSPKCHKVIRFAMTVAINRCPLWSKEQWHI